MSRAYSLAHLTVLDAPPPDLVRLAADAGYSHVGLQHTARSARLLPGQGAADLPAMLRAVPADLPICLEIPNAELALTMSDSDRVRAMLEAAKAQVALSLRETCPTC